MNLEIYTPANCGQAPKGKPTCRINQKSGVFAFSKQATNKMEIALGDAVAIGYDNEEKTWFVFKSVSGFVLRGKTDHSLAFNNTNLATRVVNSLDKSKLFVIGAPTLFDNVEYYPLLG